MPKIHKFTNSARHITAGRQVVMLAQCQYSYSYTGSGDTTLERSASSPRPSRASLADHPACFGQSLSRDAGTPDATASRDSRAISIHGFGS